MRFVRAAMYEARSRGFDLLVMGKGEDELGGDVLADALVVMDIRRDDPRIPVLTEIGLPTVLIGYPGEMFHEFPADPVAWTLADQYMFGSDLLVAPVAHRGLTSRRVYLPAGATWTNPATGTTHDGGRYLDVDAPLDVIPVFARDGRLSHLVGAI